MKRTRFFNLVLGCLSVFMFGFTGPAWAQANGHASVGLGHGEEGYLHLEEMIKHLEFSLKMSDANPNLRAHGNRALKEAKKALTYYDEALKHASEALGRPPRVPMMGEGSGNEMEDSHEHEEGSRSYEPEGSH